MYQIKTIFRTHLVVLAGASVVAAVLLLAWRAPLQHPTPVLGGRSYGCGSGWQQRYAQLHRDITRGHAPPRFLVSVTVEAGMADNLVGPDIAAVFQALPSDGCTVRKFALHRLLQPIY